MKSGSLNLRESSKPVQACRGIALHVLFGSLRGAGVLEFIGTCTVEELSWISHGAWMFVHVGLGRHKTYDWFSYLKHPTARLDGIYKTLASDRLVCRTQKIWQWQISTAKQFLWHRHLIKRRCFITANRFLSSDSCIEISLFCLSLLKHRNHLDQHFVNNSYCVVK